ncbi:ABC transporter substrate-binding protein [Pseudochelatococcus sp. B33]
MTMRKWVTRVCCVALASALVAASGGAVLSAGAAEGDGPVRGGTLIYGEIAPQYHNVQTQRATNLTVQALLSSLLDRLVSINPETKEPEPWIATEWKVNEDQTEFEFTLREGVTFSDGTPLDAEAVKANLDLLGNGRPDQKVQPNLDFVGYAGTEVLAPNKIRVTLKEPNSNFLLSLGGATAGLVAPATLARDNAGQSKLENVIGSGPFVFGSIVPDQEVVIVRRDGYAWAPPWSANQGEAHLDKVVIKIFEEVGIRTGAIQSGQVDVARGVQPKDEAPLIQRGLKPLVAKSADLTTNFAAFRVTNPAVSDRRVRQALQIGFDRDLLIRTVLSDSYEPSESIVNKVAPDFVSFADHLKFDPAEANRLLDEAGWERGADGIRRKDGEELRIVVAAVNQNVSIKPGFEFIEQQYRDLGVVLESRAGDNAFFATAATDPNVEIRSVRSHYYSGLGKLFTGERTPQPLKDIPVVTELSKLERAARTPEERAKYRKEIQKAIVLDEVLAVVLWDEVQVHIAKPEVSLGFNSATAPDFYNAWKKQ